MALNCTGAMFLDVDALVPIGVDAVQKLADLGGG